MEGRSLLLMEWAARFVALPERSDAPLDNINYVGAGKNGFDVCITIHTYIHTY